MSTLSRFLKQNKTTKTNAFYPATKSLTDEDGKPLEWEIKPISTKENEKLQEKCMIEVPIPGRPNQYRQKVDSIKYIAELIAASVVYPDLYDKDLQDSYGVMTPDGLIQEMIDSAGEWNALTEFVNKFNGFVPMQEEINEAKN